VGRGGEGDVHGDTCKESIKTKKNAISYNDSWSNQNPWRLQKSSKSRCIHCDGWGPNADFMSDQRVPLGILYYISHDLTPCGYM